LAPLILDIRFENARGQDAVARLIKRMLLRIEETLVEPDAGIWEYREAARVHTFSLLFHWTGASIAHRIAKRLNDTEMSELAARLMRTSREIIERDCYAEDLGYYADSTTTRNPDAALLMMLNLGYLDPSSDKAKRHVYGLARELAQPGGLVQRYRHQDDFGASTSTFTVCGFWYAEALARLGQREEARKVCEKLVNYANGHGLFSEDVDPASGEQLGNFPQTYSHVGLINAAFAICPLPEEMGEP